MKQELGYTLGGSVLGAGLGVIVWFMDPLKTYDEEMRKKTSLVDYFCCDNENVLEEALKTNFLPLEVMSFIGMD